MKLRLSINIGLSIWLLFLLITPASAAPRQAMRGHVPAVVASLKSAGDFPGTNHLNLAIGLPLRNQEALTNLLRQIYDPASPNYHHYLTPEQFTQKFGPTEKDYRAVMAFAKANGLEVAGTHPNRMLVDVRGSVADIQKAMHVTLRVYQHPKEARKFYAPDVEPSLDLSVPVLSIGGLDNYSLPRPRLVATPLVNGQSVAPNAGSGPSGNYMGNDFRAAYAPGVTLTGSGQIVGLLQYDGYTASDITYYESQAGLPSVTLSNVLIDGASGKPSGSGGEVEVSLDIEMAISMAPGLSKVIVYMAPNPSPWEDLLNRMATDNLAKQLSCSWYQPGGAAKPTCDQIFQQMAAQGQSFFNASGDYDAYTGLIDFPGDTPYLTQVGGTTLSTTGPGGPWMSERVWNWGNDIGSGDGISTQYPIPSWQTNISMTANQRSTTKRNTPDVALTADNVYVRANGRNYNVGGTSCAAPLWAGFAALINQQAVNNGEATVGFITPAIYSIGLGVSYATAFHDITTGNNTSHGSPTKFYAVSGYDLCTGWGTPSGQSLVDALVGPPVPTPPSIITQPQSQTNVSGSSAVFSAAAVGSFPLSYQWAFNRTNTAGATNTVLTLANVQPTNAGAYSVTVTNLYGSAISSNAVLTVLTLPPTITLQPSSQAVYVGFTANFSVSATGSLPLSCQWSFGGTNMVGATNTTLTLTNVQLSQAGSYAVLVTNLYGSAVSSNAVLTVIPPASCAPAPSGLVGWWPAEGNANDIAGTNNGALVNGVGFVAGEVGQAFSFDGVSSYVSIPDSPSLDTFVSSITIETWIKMNQLTADWNWEGIVTKGNSSWRLQVTAGAQTVAFSATGVSPHADLYGSRNVYDGQWHHVAGVYDGTNMFLYVDGTLDVSQPATGSISQNSSPLCIGQTAESTGYFFNGLIDEASIYNRALTASEIQTIYAAGSGGKCPPLTAPPAIITQPTNQTVTAGGTANFSVTASGTAPLSYQWAFNGTNIVGATNTTLTLTNVQLNQAGNYAVLVTNPYGSILSSNAVLTVNSPPPGVPVITGFNPISGIVGTSATISGLNFSPVAANNIVYFGAVQATVIAASVTNLTVTVPVGATYAPITETVNGLVAYANSPFLPTFPGGGTLSSSSLSGPTNLTAGSGPGVMVIADLDGDGKPDVIVANAYDATVYIYRNISTNGTLEAASFASPVIFTIGGSLNGLALADLDGDGRLDIVVPNYDYNNVSVFQNLCSPGSITTNSFGARVDFPVGPRPVGVAVQDLDGDGKPEIVTANYGGTTVSVLRNISTMGSITTNSFAPAVSFTVGPTPVNVMIADMDGDGKADVVTVNNGNSSQAMSVLRNLSTLGDISFATNVDFPGLPTSYCLAIGDLDGDGKPDVVIGSQPDGQSVSVYRNTGTPGSITTNSFAPQVDFAAGGWANRVAIGDLDGDGKPDVAVVTQIPDQLSLFKNTSTPGSFTSSSFAARVDFSAGWNPNGVAIGDLNEDGRPDIVFANQYDGTISIYQNVVPFGGSPPSITIQPTNQTVAVGGTANFSVTASGPPPLSYQWNFNGTNISGATNTSLTLTNVQLSQAGNYAVLVTNAYGSVLSSNAVLTVLAPTLPPAILAQPTNQTVPVNGTATFSVTASGTEPLSYFWRRNGAPIPGANGTNFTLNNVQLSDSGSQFSCLVSNVAGSAISSNALLKVIDTVANDQCGGAIIISSAAYTNAQSTTKATSIGDPVPDCVPGFGKGVWYQFTPPVSGLLIVDTFGSDFDTGLAVYTGTCDTLTETACNDDTDGVTSQISIPVTGGVTYYLLAGGYSAHAGNLVFHLTCLTPPAFVVQPTNQSVVVSSNASFSTTVSGTQPISFQWYFNNAPLVDGGRISGSTNSTLNIANILTNDAGNYQLVASNIVGVVTSSVASLTAIILPPVITQQPVDQSAFVGSNATFTAVVDGTPPFSYQWYFNGSALSDDARISGSTTAALSISNITTADAGSYALTVTNVSGSTNSTAAVLTVLVPPTITTRPIGRSVPPGLPTTFTAAASGNPAPTYQWQLNGTNIPGATSSSYAIAAVGTNDLGFYHLVASNLAGVAVSADAQLTFGPVAAWGRNLNNECLPPPNLSNVLAVAGTYQASFAVRTDGSIATWGSGAATNIPASASNVVAISTYANTANYALRSDGRVISWAGTAAPNLSNIVAVAAGYNGSYALRAEGTLTNWSKLIPDFPAGLNHLTAIAAGYNNAIALKSDGTIVVAGSGVVTNVPSGLSNVVAIAAGYTYAMALKADGKVVAWGSGTGTNLPAGMTNIAAISAGNYPNENFGLAIRSNGTVVVWGDNPYGETSPPAALTNLVSIAGAAAAYHGLALVNDGSPVILHPPVGLTAYTGRDVILHGDAAGAQPLSYQWLLNGTNIPGATNTSLVISNVQSGNAGNYQLFVSNSVNTALSLPAPLTVISNNTLVFLSVPASQTNYQGGKVSLGVTVLGNGPLRYQWFFSVTNKNYAAIPGATNDTLVLDPALAVQSGNYYVAVSNQFNFITNPPVSLRVLFARAWGFQAVSNPPVNVTNAIAIATGGYQNYYGHYFALGSDGKLTSWANYHASYGETNVSALSNSTVIAIAAGSQSSLALRSDGTVYAWGYGYYGQTNPPSGLNNVVAIACGDYHDLALKSDGTVIAWGQNLYGEGTNSLVATNAAVAIAAGTSHNLGLRADGTVFGWGYNSYGQTIIPFKATNVIAIAAGQYHSLALRANGTVVGWGNNGNGQVSIPAGLSNVVAISASSSHSTLLRADGTVVSLGYEYTGYASNAVPSDLANVIAISSGGDHDFGLLGTRAPAFTVQPVSRTIFNTTTSVWFAAKCAGVQPVRYQWLLNGTNLPAATNDTVTVTSFVLGKTNLPIQSGTYRLIASNAYGVVLSKPAKLVVTIPLGEALDATNRVWTTSGNAPWYGQAATTHDGVDAARSGAIGALQETILQTILATNWSGRCTFWWKVSSEQYFDILEFRVNGITQTSISGEVDWQQVSIPVAAGTNVLQWRYSKDASFGAGQDAGWVDQFAFVPDPPLITLQPVSQTVNMGTNVTFRVTATGYQPFFIQWWKNGTNAVGNGSILTLNNVSRAQNGVYSVVVSNVGGSTVSSNAVLKVLVPQLLGTPTLSPDGTFQFTSTDANGGLLSPSDLANFEAQASTNLVDWVTLTNALSLTNGMLQLQDNSGTNWPARFYRLIEH